MSVLKIKKVVDNSYVLCTLCILFYRVRSRILNQEMMNLKIFLKLLVGYNSDLEMKNLSLLKASA